jgi:hypothetical protein
LVEQWIAGTHATLEMLTPDGFVVFALALVGLAGDGLFAFGADELLPGGAAVPPAPPLALVAAADPVGIWAARATQATQSACRIILTAFEFDRLWTAALATNHPFRALGHRPPT